MELKTIEDENGDLKIEVPHSDRGLRWIAALAAAGIPYQLTKEEGTWYLTVSAHLADSACAEIREYERVNRNFPPPDVFARSHVFQYLPGWTAGLIFVLIIGVFDVLRGPLGPPLSLKEPGILDVVNVLEQGEYWRIITALMLHADKVHLLGNIVSGFLLVSLATGWLGTGVSLFLVLMAGGLGNYINVFIVDPGYRALGASTAVFGALGVLTAIQICWNIRRFGRTHLREVWKRSWLAFAAALGLLALAGTGAETDVGGHFFGFLAGVVLGFVPGFLLTDRLAAGYQWFFGIAAGGVLALCWWLALA